MAHQRPTTGLAAGELAQLLFDRGEVTRETTALTRSPSVVIATGLAASISSSTRCGGTTDRVRAYSGPSGLVSIRILEGAVGRLQVMGASDPEVTGTE